MTMMTANFNCSSCQCLAALFELLINTVLLERGFHPIALGLLHYLYMRFYTAAAFVGG